MEQSQPVCGCALFGWRVPVKRNVVVVLGEGINVICSEGARKQTFTSLRHDTMGHSSRARLRSGHGYTLYGIYADGEPSCACLLSHRMLVLIENIHILRTIC